MAGDLYSWVKALHVIAVISWMAGLLYLPRLYVYHCDAEPGSVQSETFKVMERRLLKAIMTPAMIASFLFGLAMMFWPGYENYLQIWMWVKFVAVIVIAGSHMAMAKWRKEFEADNNQRPQRFYRIANEVPTLAMILVVIMVIVKPF